MKPLFTIGHSNHSPERFLELLQQHGVTALADVRSSPYSRYLPHFNRVPLQSYLARSGIRYVFLGAELGARPNNPDCYVEGKALYEKIAGTESFQRGLQRVLKGVQSYRVALMCAEKDPLTCHRAILVCQHLVPFNLEIGHIHSDGEVEFHENLEERMLRLHHLEDPAPALQLSLFADSIDPPLDRAERLRIAYQKQGDKIAFVEQKPEEEKDD
ncbi:DUF488 domain-containing protein [Pannus brasiliensis CCIBt3594]|uniref:DUF488 domain-containing protein n=1 Tax=Pannus brasiliensis CCIBt3594 TaxID=1427578 RepID=A0AAW9QV14_9CHRO